MLTLFRLEYMPTFKYRKLLFGSRWWCYDIYQKTYQTSQSQQVSLRWTIYLYAKWQKG